MRTAQSGSDLRDTLIEVISDQGTWLDLAAAAGELIAADAKLNAWMVDWAKGHLSQDELLSVVELYEQITERCRAEWQLVRADATHEATHRRFVSVVRVAVEKISSVMRT